MANDTSKKPDVKDAADKAPDNKASGQLDPTPKKTDPTKVVSFEQVKAEAKEAPAAPGKADKAPDRPAPSPKGKEIPVVEDAATLKERKQKLENELREKFGIPKSAKAAEPWVAPETETVVRIPHEKLHSFKNHPFNVDKENPKFKAFVSSIRAQGVTQPVIVRPDCKDKYEIVSGHRRDAGGIEAGTPTPPVLSAPSMTTRPSSRWSRITSTTARLARWSLQRR